MATGYTVIVRDGRGEPLIGVPVVPVHSGTGAEGTPVETDVQGTAVFSGLASGAYGFRLRKVRMADATIEIVGEVHAHSGSGEGGTIAHGDLTGVTADQHHAQVHVLAGGNHTASGLTAGHVVRASSETAFGFGALQAGDLPEHDHTRHASRTRRFWVPASQFTVGFGTPTLAVRGTSGFANNYLVTWSFVEPNNQIVNATIMLPADWDGGSITPTIWWMKSAAGSGNVAFALTHRSLVAGQAPDAAGAFLSHTIAVPVVALQLAFNALTSFTPSTHRLHLALQRVGADANDTYTGDMWVAGVEFAYTADM